MKSLVKNLAVTLMAMRLNPWRLPTMLLLLFGCSTGFSAIITSPWLTRVKQTSDGLAHNHVYAIAQAADGYLWIGTPNALSRFDGDRFTTFPFRELDQSEEHNQGVRRILCSQDGGLWIAPMRGPVIHLSADYSQVTFPQTGVTNADALAMTEDKSGALWIVYVNGLIVRWKDQKSESFDDFEGVQRGNISLVTDASGGVWLGQGHNLAAFRDGHFETVQAFKSNIRVAAGRTNGVWVVAGEQLSKYDPEHGVQEFGLLPADSPRAIGTVLIEDSGGAVWIGTDTAGLFRHSDFGFEKIETSYPNIWSLAEDRDHNIWVGTGGGGLNRITRRGVQLEGVLSENLLVGIESVCQDRRGALWGVAQDGSVVCRRDGKWSTPFTNALEAASCVAADSSGAVWIGTRNKTLYRWRDGVITAWGPDDGIAASHIVTLLAGATGDLWIGEHLPDGVQCMHNGALRGFTLNGKSGKVNGMAEDAAKNIWIGTANGMLLRVEGSNLVDETSLISGAHRIIRSLYATPDGALWIGYDGWGLARLKDKQFGHIGIDQGLPDDYIAQIIGDNQGWLWFGGRDQGLFKIRQHQLEEVLARTVERVRPVFYGINEGLASKEAIGPSPSAVRSSDGKLWIPMRTELAVADPKLLLEQPEPPPVFLTQVTVDNQPVASYGGITELFHTANLKTFETSLRVGPRHRKLEFEFAALNFITPENLHFRYRLDGVDDDWVDIGRQRSVTYSRLNNGNYRFHVSASTGDGPWNETRIPLSIVVAPFFWETWWFRLGALILFTAAVAAAVRYFSFRRLHLQLRMAEQQAALDKERARIARDLHDDLGSSLMYVALVLEMNEQKSAHQLSSEPAQPCSPLVRRVVQSVDEIIWAINPRNDQLKFLLDYIVEFAIEFLHAASIRTKVDVPDLVAPRTVSPEVRHNLFLVVKEALNNIARHAHASEVRFQIVADEEHIGITVHDNGTGFACSEDKRSSDGLRNMRQRMEEIGGEFHIESKPGAGTHISLRYSLKQNHRSLLSC